MNLLLLYTCAIYWLIMSLLCYCYQMLFLETMVPTGARQGVCSWLYRWQMKKHVYRYGYKGCRWNQVVKKFKEMRKKGKDCLTNVRASFLCCNKPTGIHLPIWCRATNVMVLCINTSIHQLNIFLLLFLMRCILYILVWACSNLYLHPTKSVVEKYRCIKWINESAMQCAFRQ